MSILCALLGEELETSAEGVLESSLKVANYMFEEGVIMVHLFL